MSQFVNNTARGWQSPPRIVEVARLPKLRQIPPRFITPLEAGVPGEFSVSIAGESSNSFNIYDPDQFAVAIAGTSANAFNFIGTGALSVSIAGTSTITANFNGVGALSVSIAGTSVFSASFAGLSLIHVTFVGSSTFSATLRNETFHVTFAGSSETVATFVAVYPPPEPPPERQPFSFVIMAELPSVNGITVSVGSGARSGVVLEPANERRLAPAVLQGQSQRMTSPSVKYTVRNQ